MKKIGFATCREKPNLTADDRKVLEAACNLGHQAVPIIWTEGLMGASAPISADDFDVILIRSVWDYHRRYPEFLNWVKTLEQARIRLLNPANVIRWNSDKSYLQKLIAEGISCIPSIKISRSASIEEKFSLIEKSPWNNLIIKPAVSATAYLTFRVEKQDANLKDILNQVSQQSDIMVQPYLDQIEIDGEVSLIFFRLSDIRFSHAVLKKPASNDFRVQSDFGGVESSLEVSSQLVDFSLAALEKVPPGWIYARVDLLNWKHEPLIGEIEMIEPDLFLRHSPESYSLFVDAILQATSKYSSEHI